MIAFPRTHPRARQWIAVIALAGTPLAAQQPTTSAPTEAARACYVPGSGTVYRVRTAKAPRACVAADHVEFTLGDMPVAQAAGKPPGGTTDPVDHGSLAGLVDDDHPQYLPANGARPTASGFAVTGFTLDSPIPATGAGTRLMWVPRRAAFRAGRVLSTNWDEAALGHGSIATGIDSRASAYATTAMGNNAQALADGSTSIGWNAVSMGEQAVALGSFALASGGTSVAIGKQASAMGLSSAAVGNFVAATGSFTTALGYNGSTNEQTGAMVLSTYMPSITEPVKAVAPSQFVARANRFWFGNNNTVTALPGQLIATSTGAHLTTGGTWVNSSDVNRKEHFASVSGEEVLDKLAALSIQSWNYQDEDSTVRHIGPTAQDFRAAYGLGASETTIATVDADGVALAAAQALERRTREQSGEIAALRERLRVQAAALEELRSVLDASLRNKNARQRRD